MTEILVLYGTTEGHTATIAAHIAETARDKGHNVEVREGSKLPAGFSAEGFDGIIVGASVHMGKHQPYVAEFVKENLSLLQGMSSAFFSVSLTAAEQTEESKAETQKIATEFLDETDWHPDIVAKFAGALVYTQYNFFLRHLMRLIAKRAGGDTDTSVDYIYTDWEEVKRFTERFLERLSQSGE